RRVVRRVDEGVRHAANPSRLASQGSHSVVARVVFDLGEAKGLERSPIASGQRLACTAATCPTSARLRPVWVGLLGGNSVPSGRRYGVAAMAFVLLGSAFGGPPP